MNLDNSMIANTTEHSCIKYVRYMGFTSLQAHLALTIITGCNQRNFCYFLPKHTEYSSRNHSSTAWARIFRTYTTQTFNHIYMAQLIVNMKNTHFTTKTAQYIPPKSCSLLLWLKDKNLN